MKSISKFGVAALLFSATPLVSHAQLVGSGNAGAFGVLLQNIVIFINDVLIPFILALAFLFFVWGIVRYFIIGAASEESREAGKSLMIYSIAGFVMIIIFWGVVNLITSSIGLEGQNIAPLIPTSPVPTGGGAPGGVGGGV